MQQQSSDRWTQLSGYDANNFIPKYEGQALPQPRQRTRQAGRQVVEGFPTPITGVSAPIRRQIQPQMQQAMYEDYSLERADVMVFPIDEVFGTAPYSGDVFGMGATTPPQQRYQAPQQQYMPTSRVNNGYTSYTAMPSSSRLLQSIYFKHGSSNIKSADLKQLKKVAQDLEARGGYAVRIVGHASKKVYNVKDPVQRRIVHPRNGNETCGKK